MKEQKNIYKKVREKKLWRKKQKEEMPKHLAIQILYLSIFQPFF